MSYSRDTRKALWLKDYEALAAKISLLNVDANTHKKLQSDLDKLLAHILTCDKNPGYYKDINEGFAELNTLVEKPKKTARSAVKNSTPPELIPRLRQQPELPKQTKSTLGRCLTFFACIAETDDDREEENYRNNRARGR